MPAATGCHDIDSDSMQLSCLVVVLSGHFQAWMAEACFPGPFTVGRGKELLHSAAHEDWSLPLRQFNRQAAPSLCTAPRLPVCQDIGGASSHA